VTQRGDPRRSGQTKGSENFIITVEELRLILKAQCVEKDQTVWMTAAQAGFPTTAAEGELDNDLDRQRGKPTARCLHPAISSFIIQRQQELVTQGQAPSMTAESWTWKANGTPRKSAWSPRFGTNMLPKISPGNLILFP
jgi:hypothetical protein